MQNFIWFYSQFGDKLVDLAVIGAVFLGAKGVLRLFVNRLAQLSDRVNLRPSPAQAKRAETLKKVIIDNGNLIINAVILLMIIGLFGVDIRPILAGLGIIGLAVGFGAQALVKDFVSGLFVLIENQYNIGDLVQLGSFTGRVEKITLRSTVLVDEEGKVYYISNGSISNVVNLSEGKRKE